VRFSSTSAELFSSDLFVFLFSLAKGLFQCIACHVGHGLRRPCLDSDLSQCHHAPLFFGGGGLPYIFLYPSDLIEMTSGQAQVSVTAFKVSKK
jgi:hypothetical protein